MRSIVGFVLFASAACAPYTPPVPANPLGDEGIVRIDVRPIYESNPDGPLRMSLRKRLDRGWITLGDLCETASDGTRSSCPAHQAVFVTYATPGTYKIRAEYIGPTGSTFWGSVIVEKIEPGYVYTCSVGGEDTEGCERKPIAEAAAAASAPPVLAPAPEGAPPPAPAPGPTPTVSTVPAAGCSKDIDCPGDLICRDGACTAPAATAAPVEIVPAPVEEAPPAVTVTPAHNPACDSCPAKCAVHKSACNAGTISECFEAGACMCECKLDAGGCGDDMAALTECIATNRAKARKK